MNIFIEDDYKKIIKGLIKNRQLTNNACNYQNMARHMNIAKSYLSKVLKTGSHLDQDQLFLACDYLEVFPQERQYMDLLLQLSRCNITKRKILLKKRLEKFRTQVLKTHKQMEVDLVEHQELNEYFFEPLYQVVHACLNIPIYSSSLDLLSSQIGIKRDFLSRIIAKLEQYKVIKWENNKIVVNKKNLHIPDDSPIYKAWRERLRSASLRQLEFDDSAYSFSVLFTASESVRNKLKSSFLEYLNNIKETVEKEKEEKVYQLNFDLFTWL